MEIQELRIDEIKTDFETYAYRDELNDEAVRQYQQDIDDLPPVDVFNTEEGLILAGGYHRLEAHRQEERETIIAVIHQGTVIEAKIFACKANAQHGLNMTRSERQRSRRDFIKFNLERDPLMSNVEIATAYGGCSEATIRRDRKQLVKSGEVKDSDQRRGTDGRVIKIDDIGKSTSSNDEVNQTESLPNSSVGAATPLMQQVAKWDNFHLEMSQAYASINDLINNYGLESAQDVFREKEMATDFSKIRHFMTEIDRVLTSLESPNTSLETLSDGHHKEQQLPLSSTDDPRQLVIDV